MYVEIEEEKILFEYEDILIITKYDLQRLLVYIVTVCFKGTESQIPEEVLCSCCFPLRYEYLSK